MPRPKLNKDRYHLMLSRDWMARVKAAKPEALELSAFLELIGEFGLEWWKAAQELQPPRGSPAPRKPKGR